MRKIKARISKHKHSANTNTQTIEHTKAFQRVWLTSLPFFILFYSFQRTRLSSFSVQSVVFTPLRYIAPSIARRFVRASRRGTSEWLRRQSCCADEQGRLYEETANQTVTA